MTIVGSTGNGAGIVVIDLELGLRTVYDSDQHSLGASPLTDITLVDRDLYAWRRGEQVLRFDGGPGPWEGRGDRLTFGELSQPPMVVGQAGGDRIVFPVPTLDAAWVWGDFDGRRQTRLMPFDGSAALVSAEVDERVTPFGLSSTGTILLSDSDQTTLAFGPAGSSVKLGAGTPVAIAGEEVLMQSCDRSSCVRHWVDLQTGTERDSAEDGWRWVSVSSPPVPGHSPRLNAASLNGDQIIVGRRLAATPSSEYGLVDLVRVEVASGITAPLPLDDVQTGLAVWSRSGGQVVTFGSNGDIIIVDLETNKVTTIKRAVPDGYFPLAAG